MKEQKKRGERRGLIPLLVLLAFGLAVFSPSFAFGATNQGTGDIAGDSSDLTDSNIFNLSTTTLGLMQRAFLAVGGSVIADGSSLPRGTQVKIMFYINNNTSFAANDLSVRDVLNAAFAYQAGTLKVDNSVANCALAACTALEELAIFAAVDAAAASTDAVDGDVVSITGATIDAGNQNVANGQLDISANRVWAVLFTIEMQ